MLNYVKQYGGLEETVVHYVSYMQFFTGQIACVTCNKLKVKLNDYVFYLLVDADLHFPFLVL